MNRLRAVLLTVLMLALPLHALAAAVPAWQAHAHAAGTPQHGHVVHLHQDGAKLHSVEQDGHGQPGKVLGEHDTGQCTTPAAPFAARLAFGHDFTAERVAALAPHATFHIPDRLQRPPQA